MKRKLRLSIKIIIMLLILILISILIYGYNLSSVSREENKISFTISKGDTIDTIINNLKEQNIIRNSLFTKIHIKLNKLSNLQAGIYSLDSSMNTMEILDILNKGKVSTNEDIKVTFPEGKNIRGITKIIVDNTNNKEEDIYKLLKNEEYLDSLIEEYWFIGEEIKSEGIYYSLEGYLSMNTYLFKNRDVTPKTIFKKMLEQTDKLLTKYKEDILKSDFSIHELLTFASIVQSEGIDLKSMGTIAGVFYNRLEKNIAFQSCVTACYGTKEDECIPKKVATKNKNPYNTYLPEMIGKLPIGPVSSFGEDALKAVIYPEKHDYLFFISDTKNNLYFTKTNKEHENKKADLIKKGIFFR